MRLRNLAMIAVLSSVATTVVALALEQFYIRRGAWDFTSAGYWHVRSRGMWRLSIARYPGFRACTQYYSDMPADELDFYRENVRTRESIPGWIRNPPDAEPTPSPSGSAIHWMNDVVYGWPFPALRGYGSNVLPNSSWIPRDRPPGPAIARPCRAWVPYWPGFAANTGATMVAGGFCLTGWRWRRRRARERAGRCLACGYPVAGLTNCPECGLAP